MTESDACREDAAPEGEDPSGAEGTDRDPFDLVAEEYVDRLREGDDPPIDAYVERHPEFAERIRDLFPAIAAVERLKPRASPSPDMAGLIEGKLDRLGDFRILREIGRGGMGIVYEAEQESLGRRVAVKVLPRQSLLDPVHVKRFEREARAAARLHHTNIVPVFGVGQQEGFHYYVMQYIDGVGLDSILLELGRREAPDLDLAAARLAGASGSSEDALGSPEDASGRAGSDGSPEGLVEATTRMLREEDIDVGVPGRPAGDEPGGAEPRASSDAESAPDAEGDAPSPSVREPSGRAETRYWQNVARIGVQLAGALQYAHAQGILHRDVKPANLLVDTQGVVWITDFGLAKLADQPDVSRTGDVVGTLRYMAPEQLSGHADERTDVHGLGLTLYELAVLRPAWEGGTRSRLIHRITHEEPPSPRSVRPQLPRDLETIILKAIARDPIHRYGAAEELAADLQRFLEDRPIRARRTSLPLRAWRWARRNRAVAILGGLALLLLVVTAVVTSIGYALTRRAMRGESEARVAAEETSALAQAALDEIFENFAPSRILPDWEWTVEGADGSGAEEVQVQVPVQPVLSKQSAALMDQLLGYYRQLADRDGADGSLRLKVADANRRVGDIHQQLGQHEEARAAYDRALELYRTVPTSELAGRASGVDRNLEIARILNELGWLDRAADESGAARHREALALLEEGGDDGDLSAPRRYELARTCYALASPPGPHGGLPRPAPPRERRVGRGGRPYGRVARGPRGALAVDEPAGARTPREERPRRWGRPLAAVGGRRGGGRPSRDERVGFPGGGPGWRLARDTARSHLLRAISVLTSLAEEHPGVPEYRRLLALCYRETSRDPDLSGWVGAEDPLERATTILRELTRDFPDIADFRYELSETLALVRPEAGPGSRRGGRWSSPAPMSPPSPGDPSSRDPFPGGPSSGAATRGGGGRTGPTAAEVRTRLEEALEISEALVAEHPNIPDYVASQVRIRHRLAELLHSTGARARAEQLLRMAVDQQKALVERYDEVSSYRAPLAFLQVTLASWHEREGRRDEARDLLEDAILSIRTVLYERRDLPNTRSLLFLASHSLARILRESGEAERAQVLLEDLGRRGPLRSGSPPAAGPSGAPSSASDPGSG